MPVKPYKNLNLGRQIFQANKVECIDSKDINRYITHIAHIQEDDDVPITFLRAG